MTQPTMPFSFFLALAQEGGTGGMLTDSTPTEALTGEGGSGSPPPAGPFGGNFIFIMLALMLGFMILTSVMSGRKEKKRRAEMLGTLRKQDRVQTLGGIIGSVVEVKNDEVVLRVDDSSNTRIRFSKTAIQQVLKKNTRDQDEPAQEDTDEPVSAA